MGMRAAVETGILAYTFTGYTAYNTILNTGDAQQPVKIVFGSCKAQALA